MELYIPTIQEATRINPKNGQFLKGHKPFNKGKSQREWLTEEQCRKNVEIMNKYRKGRMDIGGYNKKTVIAVKDGKMLSVHESATAAAKKYHVFDSNIRKVCRHERNTTGGIQFFYEDDVQLVNLLNQR